MSLSLSNVSLSLPLSHVSLSLSHVSLSLSHVSLSLPVSLSCLSVSPCLTGLALLKPLSRCLRIETLNHRTKFAVSISSCYKKLTSLCYFLTSLHDNFFFFGLCRQKFTLFLKLACQTSWVKVDAVFFQAKLLRGRNKYFGPGLDWPMSLILIL